MIEANMLAPTTPGVQEIFTAEQEPTRCVKCGSEFIAGFYKGDGQVEKNIYPEQAALTHAQVAHAIKGHDGNTGVVEPCTPYCIYGCSQELTAVQVRLRDMHADKAFMSWLHDYNANAARDIGPAQMLLMWDAARAAGGGFTESHINNALMEALAKVKMSQDQADNITREFWAHLDGAA